MDQTDEQVRLLGEDGTLLQHDTYKVDLSDADQDRVVEALRRILGS